MSNHAYLKYLTELFVTHIDKTPLERKERKKKKQSSTSYSSNLFGLFPFALKVLFNRKKEV